MHLSRISIAATALLAPSIASAAAPRTFLELSNLIVLILDNATAVLIVAGIVVYFYGVSTNILSFSEKGGEKVRAYFLWGIIILFVMVSIWGILRLLRNTFFGAGSYDTTVVPTQTMESSDVFQSPKFVE